MKALQYGNIMNAIEVEVQLLAVSSLLYKIENNDYGLTDEVKADTISTLNNEIKTLTQRQKNTLAFLNPIVDEGRLEDEVDAELRKASEVDAEQQGSRNPVGSDTGE